MIVNRWEGSNTVKVYRTHLEPIPLDYGSSSPVRSNHNDSICGFKYVDEDDLGINWGRETMTQGKGITITTS